ncbi:hypothetical protein D3C74_372640 [compost metagenome]
MQEIFLQEPCRWPQQQISQLKRLTAGKSALRLQIGVFVKAGHMVIDAPETLVPENSVQADCPLFLNLRHFMHQGVADAVLLAVVQANQVFSFVQPSAQEITDPVKRVRHSPVGQSRLTLQDILGQLIADHFVGINQEDPIMDGAFHPEFPLFGISGPWVNVHPAVQAFGQLHRPVFTSSVDYNHLIGE